MFGSQVETIAVIIGILLIFVGLVGWVTKSSSRSLVVLAAGAFLLLGIAIAKGTL